MSAVPECGVLGPVILVPLIDPSFLNSSCMCFQVSQVGAFVEPVVVDSPLALYEVDRQPVAAFRFAVCVLPLEDDDVLAGDTFGLVSSFAGVEDLGHVDVVHRVEVRELVEPEEVVAVVFLLADEGLQLSDADAQACLVVVSLRVVGVLAMSDHLLVLDPAAHSVENGTLSLVVARLENAGIRQ